MWRTCSPTAGACRELELLVHTTGHDAHCTVQLRISLCSSFLWIIGHISRQWTLLAMAAGHFICTVNSSAFLTLYPSPCLLLFLCPPFHFFYQCVHTQWAPIMREDGAFSPVKLKQELPFPKLFSEEPVVTCHSCPGGGCVVSPPVFVSTFFTKNSGGFGARCGTSYLLLSFQASRGEWLVPLPLSPIMEPFF